MSLPEPLRVFLAANDVAADTIEQLMATGLPRCFWCVAAAAIARRLKGGRGTVGDTRVRPSVDEAALLDEVEAAVGARPLAAPFPARCFVLPATTPLAHTAAYTDGRMVCLDASSALAVACLDPQPGDDCLDVCCAPGGKLALIADLVAPAHGSVTGVDVAPARLASCRSLVRRLRLPRVRLFCADARRFDVEAPPLATRGPIAQAMRAAPPDQPDAPLPTDAPRLLRRRWRHTGRLYDRVLVDAECTHDGSARHLLKAGAAPAAWDAFVRQSLDPARLCDLPALQRDLLATGFGLLRPGGTLVYATCSLTRAQNEDVVAAFLASPLGAASAILMPATPAIYASAVPAACRVALHDHHVVVPPALPHVLRLDPARSATSGLFVATIMKRSVTPPGQL